MKALYITTLLTLLALIVKAQDANTLEIIPFDSEKFNKEYKEFPFDTLGILQDTVAMNTPNPYQMRILEVPKNQMAPMPNMEIRDDIHYHMQIKKYRNFYEPDPPVLQYKLLPDQKGKEKDDKSGKD